ncbi:MAG: PTS sugar transporter subunit IIB, partial [Anaerolineae bacterium]|nr:PTS sugar transporter subunit IIB [Anaerolineae bacterium]
WCRHKSFSRIVIIDDQVAGDAFMQQVLKLAAPPNLTVDVYTVEKSLEVLNDDAIQRETTMLLMKTPQTARRLYEGELGYKQLNVGGMGSGPGRKNIFKNIAVSKDDIVDLKFLMDKGVEITLLTVPGEKSKAFADLARKL